MSKALEILADIKRHNDRVGVHLERATSALEKALQLLGTVNASVDTLPKGQDAKQGLAGTEGSAVGEAETPGSSSNHSIEIEE